LISVVQERFNEFKRDLGDSNTEWDLNGFHINMYIMKLKKKYE